MSLENSPACSTLPLPLPLPACSEPDGALHTAALHPDRCGVARLACHWGMSPGRMASAFCNCTCNRSIPPAEYCSRGSLYDVLKRASWDNDLASQLTWRLRLSIVSEPEQAWKGGQAAEAGLGSCYFTEARRVAPFCDISQTGF